MCNYTVTYAEKIDIEVWGSGSPTHTPVRLTLIPFSMFTGFVDPFSAFSAYVLVCNMCYYPSIRG